MLQFSNSFLRSFLLSSVLCFCAVFTMQGQYSIAYIDTDEVLKAMPEYRNTEVALEIFQKQLLKQLDSEKKAIAKYYNQVIEEVKAGALSAKQQQDAEVKLQKMQQDLEEQTNDADRQLLAKERALSKPMYEKFEKGIASVAKKNGYAYILDKKALMAYGGGTDATGKLKKELGL
jgi:outer membrane protein